MHSWLSLSSTADHGTDRNNRSEQVGMRYIAEAVFGLEYLGKTSSQMSRSPIIWSVNDRSPIKKKKWSVPITAVVFWNSSISDRSPIITDQFMIFKPIITDHKNGGQWPPSNLQCRSHHGFPLYRSHEAQKKKNRLKLDRSPTWSPHRNPDYMSAVKRRHALLASYRGTP